MWLAKKKGRYRAFRWKRDAQGKIQTEVSTVTYANGETRKVLRPRIEIFSPSNLGEVEQAPSKGGAATCPISGFTTAVESVRRQLAARAGGASDARLVAVVTLRDDRAGRNYRIATDEDSLPAQRAAAALDRQLRDNADKIPPIPEGQLNHLRGFFNIVLYGMTTWGDLFSPRQKLVLTTFSRFARRAGETIASESDPQFAVAIQTCLALAVTRHADINASLSTWHNARELINHVFSRQALPMVWDFAEANSFCEASGAFLGGVDWICRVLEQVVPNVGQAEQASATQHPLPADSADFIFTDPPYYAAIPYADLSDFFYSWLRRTLVTVQPELFRDALSPKDLECVSLSHRAAMYRQKDPAWFERMMTDACAEARRVDRPSGIGVFVFANKETSGWEAMLAALMSSGWIITASWPVDTEMGTRLRARDSAALASSVHLVCRPRENPDGSVPTEDVGDWRDVLQELPRRIHEWMPRLAEEGVVGADAIFACLGPGLEIFSRYSRVEKTSGEVVPLREYLEHVWAAVSKEALSVIFHDPDTAGLEPDARLTAMWLWTLGAGTTAEANGSASDAEDTAETDAEEGNGAKSAKTAGFTLEYDAARKIAQGLGVHLEKAISIVEVKGESARLLSVAERTRHLLGKDAKDGADPGKRPRKKQPAQRSLFDELAAVEEDAGGAGVITVREIQAGATVLDRVHQAMILFGAGRGEALKRFLVEEGGGKDARFWKLAQALSALYPNAGDEKRWVDGVLARKKGLGF
jgi:putative DNA methylase